MVDMLLLALWVSASLGALATIRKMWPVELRRAHNDVVGWQISVIGTTYAVILGFMLFNVWDNFRVARVNAEAEANSVVNLYRLASGLEASDAENIRRATGTYAQLMIAEEWPAMEHATYSHKGLELTERMWATLSQAGKSQAASSTVVEQALSELSVLTQRRRMRELQSENGLPGILWAVLIVGAIITVLAGCFLATENYRLHQVLTVCLSLLLGLSLFAIAEIDKPFRGAVRVMPDGFQLALRTFQEKR